MKYRALQLNILAEKVFERPIIALLQDEGAKGYTIYEGGGNGAFHLHPSDHSSVTDAFHIMKIEVIMADEEAANRIAERLMTEFFEDQPGIVSLTEAWVYRKQKF